MDQTLDEALCAKYPRIFRDRHAPMNQTCMCWGFEHGNGWYNIIDMLCANIQSHINWTRKERARALQYNRALGRAIRGDESGLIKFFSFKEGPPSDWVLSKVADALADPEPQCRQVPEACPQVVAVQVKEKFGTLRFYYDGGDDMIDGMVRMAESMSAVTCETCGAPGTTGGRGWISTLCETHRAENEAKYAKT